MTNVSDLLAVIPTQTVVGMWLAPDTAPRQSGFVSLGSRRYREWLTLASAGREKELPDADRDTDETSETRRPGSQR